MIKVKDVEIIIPEWANYLANDYNGELYAFENKPFLVDEIEEEGIFDVKEGKVEMISKCSQITNWRESLITLE